MATLKRAIKRLHLKHPAAKHLVVGHIMEIAGAALGAAKYDLLAHGLLAGGAGVFLFGMMVTIAGDAD